MLTQSCNHFDFKRLQGTLYQSHCCCTRTISKAQASRSSREGSPTTRPRTTPSQEATLAQAQDEESSEYESSSEEQTPRLRPTNIQVTEDSETPEQQDLEETPPQEQLHQEGAPKPDPEEDPDTPELTGPAPPAPPSQPPTRHSSQS